MAFMHASLSKRAQQQGISLPIVLVALVLLSFAAVGLIRSVDTGSLIVGNLAFKKASSATADRTAETAITWLQNNNNTTLYENITASGYYATSLTNLDVTGKSALTSRVLVDWEGNSCAYATSGTFTGGCVAPSATTTANSFSSNFVITRMCKTTGDPNATSNGCAKPVSTNSGDSPKKGELKHGEDKRFSAPAGPYFRIVVRTVGPRNSVSFTETYVHF